AIKERERLQLEIGGELEVGEAIERAQALVELGRSELEGLAGRLTQERRAGAEALTSGVQSELRGLRLDDARLEVRLEPRGQIEVQGADSAAIYFSANPGEALAPLARVASGGELSRVMLAIKTVSAASDQVSTLVFDEIDAGIGGEAALQVGLRLRRLAGQRQVLVVTHLAQIACFADRHLVVEKQAGADGRNLVRVRHLSSEHERAAELARMMSGGVTAKALDRALELIQEAGAGS
ncbi:MAG: DNA repair protein RecN, partial [Candidatus Dormibacteraceae bacterium]